MPQLEDQSVIPQKPDVQTNLNENRGVPPVFDAHDFTSVNPIVQKSINLIQSNLPDSFKSVVPPSEPGMAAPKTESIGKPPPADCQIADPAPCH